MNYDIHNVEKLTEIQIALGFPADHIERSGTLNSRNLVVHGHGAALDQRARENRPWRADEISADCVLVNGTAVERKSLSHGECCAFDPRCTLKHGPGIPAAQSHYPPAEYDDAFNAPPCALCQAHEHGADECSRGEESAS